MCPGPAMLWFEVGNGISDKSFPNSSEGAEISVNSTDKSKITRKQSKNEQARTRESEEYKKKPKNQSRSQKSQASVKSSQRKVNHWSTKVNKNHNIPF
ncbi:hypothetical protein Tco_0537346 [Tanacetum coccineum]